MELLQKTTGEAASESGRLLGEPFTAQPTLCRSTRNVPSRLCPRDVSELAALLLAGSTRVHPISSGRNWGFGSYLPYREGVSLLDLSIWKKIGPLDRDTLSVRIEPGVTQGELCQWLDAHAPELRCNVTGAGTATSILGCALERGLGYAGPMDKCVFGLEVLLPDGSMVLPTNHPARDHAVGPSFEQIFFQSNYGVIVAARVRLRMRQEREEAIVLTGSFETILRGLVIGYENGLLSLPTHVSEPGRTDRLALNRLRQLKGREVTEAEVARIFPRRDAHVALAAIHGRKTVVRASWKELLRLLPPGLGAQRLNARSAAVLERLGRFFGLSSQADRLAAFLPILGLTWGTPSDAGLLALAQSPENTDPDAAPEGAIYGNAVSAPTVSQVGRVSATVRANWHNVACTYIVTSAHCVVTVYTLHFTDAETAAVKAAEKKLANALVALGYPPYRLGINQVAPANPLHSLFKKTLDPRGIIDPGRYESESSCAAE